MADEKRKPSTGIGSYLYRGALFAPIGIGAKATMRAYLEANKGVPSIASNAAPYTVANNTIQQLANANAAAAAQSYPGLRPWQSSRFESLAASIQNLGKEDIVAAWEGAATAAGMSTSAKQAIIERIAQAATPAEVLQNLQFTLGTGGTSIYAQRATSLFLQNVAAFEKQAAIGGISKPQDLGLSGSAFRKVAGKSTKHLTLARMPEGLLKDELLRLQGNVGGTMQLDILTRKGVPGSSLRVKLFGGILPENSPLTLHVAMPLAENPNLVVHGAEQQSTYIAGQYKTLMEGNKVRITFNAAEWAIHRANEDLIPALLDAKRRAGGRLTRDIVSPIKSHYNQLIASQREYVNSMPDATHLGTDLYIQQRSNIAHIFPEGGANYRPGRGFKMPRLDLLDRAQLLETGLDEGGVKVPIFPAHSPNQIAHDVVATQDPRGGLFAAYESFGRRPMQSLRQASATETAINAIESDPFNRRFSWASRNDRGPAAMVRTLFVSDRHAQKLSDMGMGTQGVSFISESQARFRAVSRMKPLIISSKEIRGAANYLQAGQAVWNDINADLREGEILGLSPEGKPVVAGKNMQLRSARAFQDKARGDYVQLMVEESVGSPDWAKYFGTAKTMQHEISASRMKRLVSRGFGVNSPVDAIVSASELKKNKSALYQQLFTSLADFSHTNMNSGKKMGKVARRFLSGPAAFVAEVLQNAAAASNPDDYVVAQALGVARAGKLTPEQMGLSFGMVPEALGLAGENSRELQQSWLQRMTAASREWSSPDALKQALETPVSRGYWKKRVGITRAEAAQINRGIAQGVGQFWFEDVVGPGAGNVGTIEPRMFEMMGSPHWGEFGDVLRNEVAGRVLHERGYRLMEQESLLRSALSMVDKQELAGAISPGEITPEHWDSGFNLRVKDFGDVSIPAAEEISSLAQYQTASGKRINPELGKAYRELAGAAKRYEAGDVGKEYMTQTLERVAGQTGKAALATVGGHGGLLRGSLPGSLQLTGVSAPNKWQRKLLGPTDIGISASSADTMLRQMEEIYGPEAMAETRAQIWKRGGKANIGGSFYGLTMRHPNIGPGGINAARYVITSEHGDYAMFNERERRGYLSSRVMTNEEVAGAITDGRISKGTAKQLGLEKLDSVRLGVMPRMAGDLDADNYIAAMLSPGAGKGAAAQVNNAEMELYSFRNQLLKSKAAKGTVSLGEAARMADDALRLGAVREHIGATSTALQNAKAGVLLQSASLGPSASMDALQLLEAMEQLPISGKHIAEGDAPRIIDTLGLIKQSVANKNSEQMRAAVDEVFKHAPDTRKALLGEGASLLYSKPGGGMEHVPLRGLNLNTTIGNIMDSLRAAESQGAELGLNALQLRDLVKNKSANAAGPTPEALRVLASKGGADHSVFGGFIKPVSERGTMAKIGSKLSAMKNRAIAFGEKVLPHAKPLAIGFAASLAIASVLSAPKMSIDPPINPTPNLGSGSGGQDLPTNIHPNSHISGAPSAPSPIPPGHAFINGPGSGMIVQAGGRAPGGAAYGRMNHAIGLGIGGGGVRSSVYDDRSSLTPQKLSDILRSGR